MCYVPQNFLVPVDFLSCLFLVVSSVETSLTYCSCVLPLFLFSSVFLDICDIVIGTLATVAVSFRLEKQGCRFS